MKTLLQMMTEALAQAGLDSSYNAQARSWVNTILEAQCRNYDWPYYALTYADQPFVAGQTTYTLPANFARPDQNVYLVQNANNAQNNQRSGLVKMVDRGLFEQVRSNTTNGNPTTSTIQWNYVDNGSAPTPVLIFDASPSSLSNLLWRMPYFRVATSVDLTGTDDNNIPDFMPQDFLINELKKYAFENIDDERYQVKAQENAQTLQAVKINANMAKTSKINLAPEVYPPGYRGPGSSSSGNGWMGP